MYVYVIDIALALEMHRQRTYVRDGQSFFGPSLHTMVRSNSGDLIYCHYSAFMFLVDFLEEHLGSGKPCFIRNNIFFLEDLTCS